MNVTWQPEGINVLTVPSTGCHKLYGVSKKLQSVHQLNVKSMI